MAAAAVHPDYTCQFYSPCHKGNSPAGDPDNLDHKRYHLATGHYIPRYQTEWAVCTTDNTDS